jgi:hypothetical protein
MAPFSLPQTGPSQGQTNGSFWNGEGEQYFHQDPLSPHGNAQNGFDSLHSFQVSQEPQSGQNHGRGSFSGSSMGPWSAELSSTEMSRHPSMDSIETHSQGTTYSSTVDSFDQIRSARIFSSDSQMSYHVPSERSDSSDRSNSPVNTALYTPTPLEISEFENYSYQNGEDVTGDHPMFHRNSIAGVATPANIPLTSGPSFNMFPPSEDEIFLSLATGPNSLSSQGPVSRDSVSCIPSAMMDSPALWDGTDLLDSRGSSPILLEAPWTLPSQQMMTSTTNSPLDYSPSLDGPSPRYVPEFTDLVEQAPYASTGDRVSRKQIGPRQSKVTSDLAAASRRPRLPGSSETSEESFKLVGRSSADFDNTAREHPLYHNVTPKADGLYHCPFENDPKANCTHKPEKLKCNYEYDPVLSLPHCLLS